MNKIFCTSCGHKNIYEVNEPKFCAGCGSAIRGGVSSDVVRASESSASVEVDMGNGSSLGSINLDKLRNNIVAEGNSKQVKLGDIMGSSSSDSSDEFVRGESNLPDGDELIQRSQQDCGSSKPIDIDG
jgi:hypothetical protein